MLLASILLLGALPKSGALARSVANLPETVSSDAKMDAKDSSAARELPSMPKPKVSIDAEGDGVTANVAGAEAVQPPRVALPVQPVKPAYTRPRETRGQRVAWYTLAVTGHGAAAFDAYSTRLAISGTKIMMQQPRIAGFTRDNRRYDLRAQAAGQDITKPDLVELQGIHATSKRRRATAFTTARRSCLR